MIGQDALVQEKNPQSPHKGVYWDKKWHKWTAELSRTLASGRLKIRLGRFLKDDDAAEAIRRAKEFLDKGGDPNKLRSMDFKARRRRAWHRKPKRGQYNRAYYLKRKQKLLDKSASIPVEVPDARSLT